MFETGSWVTEFFFSFFFIFKFLEEPKYSIETNSQHVRVGKSQMEKSSYHDSFNNKSVRTHETLRAARSFHTVFQTFGFELC